MREAKAGQKNVEIYDHMGRLRTDKIPDVLSATYCQGCFYKGNARVGKFDKDGHAGDPIREELVRAQVPYAVTLIIYESKFQIEPTKREYFVYAPLEVQKAAEIAIRLWQRWERPPRPEFIFEDMREVYPKVGEGVVAQPIGDEDFAQHWKYVRTKKYKAAGHPDDPFAFTCLDQDVIAFKTSDFQQGLIVKIR